MIDFKLEPVRQQARKLRHLGIFEWVSPDFSPSLQSLPGYTTIFVSPPIDCTSKRRRSTGPLLEPLDRSADYTKSRTESTGCFSSTWRKQTITAAAMLWNRARRITGRNTGMTADTTTTTFRWRESIGLMLMLTVHGPGRLFRQRRSGRCRRGPAWKVNTTRGVMRWIKAGRTYFAEPVKGEHL